MPNRLAQETSPYLLQHADNPVDWYPWGEAALSEAGVTGKPILLSIGYSACHWCHVMAHESFEDEDTARLMNQWFVNIKVDREERPDLDKIYQLAHQVLTRRAGGWPLTMFLSPVDQLPFFGGTYFPGRPRHGMASFRDVLERVHAWFEENRSALPEQNQALGEFFQQVASVQPAESAALNDQPVGLAMQALRAEFDERHGGFGGAPKFPQPPVLELLLQNADRPGEARMLTGTLDAMARRGLFDHLAGGFFRYCVDAAWDIPHFEKMLYDNAQLLGLFAQAAVVCGRADYRLVAEATARWVLSDMRSPQGGFYSSLDADSEGEEGKFYVWTPAQVQGLLADDRWRIFSKAFGLDRPPNFEQRAWHLQRGETDAGLAERLALDPRALRETLEAARVKLLAARNERVPPGLDDKQLTGWNALMIQGLAQAGRLLDRQAYTDAAESGLAFMQQSLWRDGRLLASFKDNDARLAAYLDDYAYLLAACLELLQARWDSDTLRFATDLAEALLTHFQDPAGGGFYFTADDHETLIQRPRPFADEAVPSGNGIAAQTLLRLGHLLAEPRYLDAAERTLRAAWAQIRQAPHAHPSLLIALMEYLEPAQQIIVRGPQADLAQWREDLREHYRPSRSAFLIPNEAGALPDPLSAYRAGEAVSAWVCTGASCSAPVDNPGEFAELLRQLKEN